MKTVRTVVDLPGPVPALIKVDNDPLGPFIKRSLAVEFYREGKLSLGKAAELAGTKSKWEMLMLLSERGVVSNSTPLIALAKINRLDLLKDYFDEIYILEEVYDEVVRRGGIWLAAPRWHLAPGSAARQENKPQPKKLPVE